MKISSCYLKSLISFCRRKLEINSPQMLKIKTILLKLMVLCISSRKQIEFFRIYLYDYIATFGHALKKSNHIKHPELIFCFLTFRLSAWSLTFGDHRESSLIQWALMSTAEFFYYKIIIRKIKTSRLYLH